MSAILPWTPRLHRKGELRRGTRECSFSCRHLGLDDEASGKRQAAQAPESRVRGNAVDYGTSTLELRPGIMRRLHGLGEAEDVFLVGQARTQCEAEGEEGSSQ